MSANLYSCTRCGTSLGYTTTNPKDDPDPLKGQVLPPGLLPKMARDTRVCDRCYEYIKRMEYIHWDLTNAVDIVQAHGKCVDGEISAEAYLQAFVTLLAAPYKTNDREE